MKNRYCKSSRISEKKMREIVRCFSADLTALQTAELSGLNRNTINRFYRALRERIYQACEAQRPMFGIVEVDESLFGAKRVKGKRGRGAYSLPRT
jgi:transposase